MSLEKITNTKNFSDSGIQKKNILYSLYLKYCSIEGFFHTLPDFLIIGFPKCGTTSLYEYLMKHPNIFSPKGKEIDFFDRLYFNGSNWYRHGFPTKLKKFVVENFKHTKFLTGEATPRYVEHPHALYRIKSLIPNAKFIVLLRNPIDRAFSHYKMNLRNGYEHLSFEDAIKHEKIRTANRYKKMSDNKKYYSWNYDLYGYLQHGIYVEKLKNWFDIFHKKQFLIIQSENFLKYPEETFKQTTKFLNLPDWKLNTYQQFKKSTQKELKIEPQFRKELVDYFTPYNEKLYKFLGRNFHWDE